MALSSPPDAQNEKSSPHKPVERRERPMTKVIIRRLPPGITQEAFVTQVSPIPEYSHLYTIKGDMTLGENAFTRVYINFINAEDIFDFKEKFDNYVFVDSKGHEYPAVVEFASFQKVPKKRNKARQDLKSGLIESDPVYLDFLESLKSQPNKEEKPEFSYQPSSDNKNDCSTPLLDYIKQRRVDRQRIREEKREERRKRDVERKRIKDDERKKRYEERSPSKTVVIKAVKTEESNEGESKIKENPEKKDDIHKEKTDEKSNFKTHERKYEDRKPVSTYKSKNLKNDKEYVDKREYKAKREDYREREYRHKSYDDYKKEPEKFIKKVKKYSERREERKSTIKKFEEKNVDIACSSKNAELKTEEQKDNEHFDEITAKADESTIDEAIDHSEQRRTSESENERDSKSKNKENDPRIQRRIRNKDRPTMAIYKPGMLRKKGPDSADEKVTVDKET